MRILVTGAGGLLGGRIAELLCPAHDVVAARYEAAPPAGLATVMLRLELDDSIEAAVVDSKADAVVHSAALAEADKCEARPDLAQRLNVGASATLARICEARGLRLVAFSTDMVFGGDRPDWNEGDTPRPLQAYGRSKVAGEAAVLAACPGAAILRVALVLGRGHGRRGTASESIAWALASGAELRLFTDQYRTPVDPESVADAVSRLLTTAARGVFHAGGPERISRHELGLRVARTLGLPADGIVATSQDTAPAAAARPRDVSMTCGRLRDLGWQPRPVSVAIAEGREAPAGSRAPS